MKDTIEFIVTIVITSIKLTLHVMAIIALSKYIIA